MNHLIGAEKLISLWDALDKEMLESAVADDVGHSIPEKSTRVQIRPRECWKQVLSCGIWTGKPHPPPYSFGDSDEEWSGRLVLQQDLGLVTWNYSWKFRNLIRERWLRTFCNLYSLLLFLPCYWWQWWIAILPRPRDINISCFHFTRHYLKHIFVRTIVHYLKFVDRQLTMKPRRRHSRLRVLTSTARPFVPLEPVHYCRARFRFRRPRQVLAKNRRMSRAAFDRLLARKWGQGAHIASRKEVALVSLRAGRILVDVLISCRCCSRAFCAILRMASSASRARLSEENSCGISKELW